MPSGIFVIRAEGSLMETKWSVYYPKNFSDSNLKSSFALYGRLMRVCGIYQDRTAIEYMGSDMSYSQLAKTVSRVAIMWKNLGVTPGDKVILCMGECPDMIFSIYALDGLGACSVLMIPNSSTEHFEQIVNNTGARFALMSFNQYDNYAGSISNTPIRTVVLGKYSDYITGIARNAFRLYPLSAYDANVPAYKNRKDKTIKVIPWHEAMSVSEIDVTTRQFEPDQDSSRECVMLETENDADGGTVCAYNAAMINTEANISMFIEKESETRLGRPARILCMNEVCFAFGFSIGMNDVLLSGQTLIVFTWFDAERLVQPVMRYRPDILIGYSGTIARLNSQGINRSVMRSVSMIICGSSLLTSSQKAELLTRSGRSEDELRICTVSGCDETMAFAYTPEGTTSDRMIGIPMPGVFMKVADSETGEDMPQGRPGEIAVCSPVFHLGIIRDGKKVPGSFRHLPDGRNWFFTGITGKMDEQGFFSLISRPGKIYKINSFPVYPAQVDRVISMVKGVVDVASVVVEEVYGPKLIAAVVPSEELLFDNDLLADLKKRITDECLMMLHESMCPSEVEFLVSLPVDSAGNKDYAKVLERIGKGREFAGN
jgi:acyl-CoA synthetase (AMP-forming)/AMP-acid ligase II